MADQLQTLGLAGHHQLLGRTGNGYSGDAISHLIVDADQSAGAVVRTGLPALS